MQPPSETLVRPMQPDRQGSCVAQDVELVITRGIARQRVRSVVSPVFMIGTAADCDLVLGDERFAEVHAYLLVGQGPILLRWLGIDPEITVNGSRIDHVSLRDMDRIRTGPYEFLVRIGSKRREQSPSGDSVPVPHMSRAELATDSTNSIGVFDPTDDAASVLAFQLEQIEAALPSGEPPIEVDENSRVLRVYRGPDPQPVGTSTAGDRSTARNLPPWPRWPMNPHAFVS